MPASSIPLLHLQKHLWKSGVALKQCLFAPKSIQVPIDCVPVYCPVLLIPQGRGKRRAKQ